MLVVISQVLFMFLVLLVPSIMVCVGWGLLMHILGNDTSDERYWDD